MCIAPAEIIEKYRAGVVNLDDATDYFYKRLHPRRYRWLKWAPRRIRDYGLLKHYGVNAIALFPSFVLASVLLPFTALHYQRWSKKLGAVIRAESQSPRTPKEIAFTIISRSLGPSNSQK